MRAFLAYSNGVNEQPYTGGVSVNGRWVWACYRELRSDKDILQNSSCE
jgi:hypothetical protein